MYERYFDTLERLLLEAQTANRDAIPVAARVIADTVGEDGIIHVFGSGHSQLLALELADRAGGLAPVEVIFDPSYGRAETIDGYAGTLLRHYNLLPPDCLVVISNSGRNAAPIEMALAGKERGLPVIAVTAADFSRSVSSRHSSGLRLIDIADVVLDTCGIAGDAVVRVEGVPSNVGPTSTPVGAALLNAVFVEAIAELVRRGVEPPIWLSGNIDDADRHNEALDTRYRGRVRSVT